MGIIDKMEDIHDLEALKDVEPNKYHHAIVDAFERGETVGDIARTLAHGDEKKRKKYATKLRSMVRNDRILQRALIERGQMNLLTAVPMASVAIGKRAAKGRMDAAKFVMEATGVHNPRVRHEHSGEVRVSLDLPRPKFAEAKVIEIDDAEVIE